MIIYAVYIIGENGLTILSENFQETSTLPDQQLLGGLFRIGLLMMEQVQMKKIQLISFQKMGSIKYPLRYLIMMVHLTLFQNQLK